jgi:AsmA-like C-terminal region
VTGSGMTQAAIEKSLAGTVEFSVQNGEVHNLSVLTTIDRVFGSGSSGGADTKFEVLSGTATIANGQAKTTDLTLKSGDLTLAGAGTLALVDQSLNLVLTAQLSPARSAQIAHAVPLSSRLENASGQMQLPVKITGTATSPKVEGIAVTAISKQRVQGLVKQLFKK